MTDLAGNLRAVRARIDAAARAAGRDRRRCALLAVSKTWPADDVRALAALGQLDFGENRAQELIAQGGGARRPAGALALHRPAAAQQGRRRGPARRGGPHRRPAVARPRPRPGGAGRRAPGRGPGPGRPRAGRRASSPPAAVPRPRDVPAPGRRWSRSAPACGCSGLMAVAPRGEDPAPAFERLAALAARVRGRPPGGRRAVGGHERRPRGGRRGRRDGRACRNRVVRRSAPTLR